LIFEKEVTMSNSQIKLLASLAKKLKTAKRDRNEIVITLNAAGILTKKENFTTNFSNLKKVVSVSKQV
jgi:hypothetical protein